MKFKKEAIVLTVFFILILQINTALSQAENEPYRIPEITVQGDETYKINKPIKVSYTIIPHVSENIVYSFFVTCPGEINTIVQSESLQLNEGIIQKKSFDVVLQKAVNPQNCTFDFSIEEPYSHEVIENFELISDGLVVDKKESDKHLLQIIKSNYHIILPIIGVIVFVIGSLFCYHLIFKHRIRTETSKIPTALEEYVQKELKKGFSKKQIKETLISRGWDKNEVEGAIRKS